MTGHSHGVVWGDPPPSRRGTGSTSVWPDRLAPLREAPGKWGRLVSDDPDGAFSSGVVSQLNHGDRRGVEAGQYEFVGRGDPALTKNRQFIWARFIGGES